MKRALVLTFIIVAYVADSLIRGMKNVLALVSRIVVWIAALFSLRGIVKRTLLLIVVIAICIAGFLSIRGVMPFMAIFGNSMEPELQAGDMILIEEMSPSEVEEDDIIVFTIPEAVREYYNYPQVVAHRVISVRESESGVTFRTKGDNTGEDPFTVRPQDIRGQVSKQVSYLGFPLLFFQSQQGVIFIIIALSLLALYLYSDEINRGRQIVHRSIFAPIIAENQHASQVLEQRMETTEMGMAGTQQALNSFASAIAEYAEHLKSHTSAIQGLGEASQELKKGAAEQNKVLTRIVEVMEQGRPKIEEIESEVEVMEQAGPKIEEIETETEAEVQFPPGCFRSRRKLTETRK